MSETKAKVPEAKGAGGKKKDPSKSVGTRFKKWVRGYVSEFKKIVWPTRKQIVKNTVITIVMLLVVGAFVWVLDFAFTTILDLLLKLM